MLGTGVTMATTAADAHGALVELLDQHVRELVRREGVDPQRDAPVVRRIAEGVVREHDERSLTGVVAPVPDIDAVVGELVARVSGFGPLQPFLDDPAVEEIWINDPSRVFVARHGRHELTNLMLSTAQVQELVERMLKSSADGGSTSASRSWTRCCRRATGCTWCWRASAAASRRSTSASSCSAPRGCTTWSSSAACHRRPRRSSRPPSGPVSTSWSPEGRRRARPPC